MINYSINTDYRRTVTLILALLSAGTATMLATLLADINVKVFIPSAFAIFGVYHWLFDCFLWKMTILKRIHGIPNLNGNWKGVVKRSKDGQNFIELPVKAVIQQTWSKIQIEVISPKSRSILVCIIIDITGNSRKCIDYIYELKPILEGDNENRRGEGCQNLILENDKLLSGRFFSSKLRKGTLVLERHK